MNKRYFFRVMRLLILFLLGGFIHVSATTYAQGVTFSGKHVPIEQALEAIRKQGGYEVTINRSLLKSSRPVSIEAKEMPVSEFLHLILRDQPLEAKIREKTIVLSKKQENHIEGTEETLAKKWALAFPEVQGRIVDTLGNAIVGASVRVLNSAGRRTALATTTDKEGKFFLKNVPEEAQLEISFVGYVSQRLMISPDLGAIVLIAVTSALQEVEVMVNTGYQQINKNNSPGSMVRIDSTQLRLNVAGALTDRLKFISPSLLVTKTVEGKNRLQIRGMYALREDVARPLIILDNFPYEGDLDDINPEEIESVNILRDASAAAIWGARAGNGVIVLNSFRNKSKGFKLQVQAHTSWQSKPNLLGNQQILSTPDFLEFERYKFSLGYGLSDTADYRKPTLSPLYELLIAQKRGSVSNESVQEQLHQWSLTDLRQEYTDHVYRSSWTNRYNVSLQHGTNTSSTLLTLGLENDVQEIIRNSGQRISVMLNQTLKPVKFLEIDLGVRYFQQENKLNGPSAYGQLNVNGQQLSPYLRFYDEQGQPENWDIYFRKDFTDMDDQSKLHDWKFRPLQDMDIVDRTRHQKKLIADLGLRFIVDAKSKIQFNYRGETLNNGYDYYYPKESYISRNLINLFTKIENGMPVYQIPNEGILDYGDGKGSAHFFRGQYNFDAQYQKHTIRAILGGELSIGDDDQRSGRIYGFNDYLNIASVPYTVLMPSYGNVAGYMYIPFLEGLSATHNRNVSFYSNIHYSWTQKYILSLSARRDASNFFGVNTNQKWKPLWSIGGLWKLHEEEFFKSIPLSILEMRATYGKSGNINKSATALPTLRYNPASDQITQLPSASIGGGYNPDLRWEEVNTMNLGINLASPSGRLRGSIEYYLKNARDVIAQEPVDNTTGYSSNPKNSAHIDGRGLDISMQVDVLKHGDWQWQMTANHSYAKFEVTKYYGAGVDKYMGYVGDGSSLAILEGLNPYSLVSYRWAGLDPVDGRPLGYVNGQLSSDYEKLIYQPFSDQVLSGSAIPTNFGNVLQRIVYKQFNLSINMSYRLGHYFRKNTISYEKAFMNDLVHSDYLYRWQKEGDELYTSIPSMAYPLDNRRDQFYMHSDINVLKASSFRLNDVQLAYTWNTGWLLQEKRSVSAFLNVNQINWVFWKANREGIDPDFKDGFVPSKQWSLGFKVNL